MATPWVTAAEVLAHVGGFAQLLEHLSGRRISARAKYFTHVESGREYRRDSVYISYDWWVESEWAPQYEGDDRFRFSNGFIDVVAHGVEFLVDDELVPLPAPPEVAAEPPPADLAAPKPEPAAPDMDAPNRLPPKPKPRHPGGPDPDHDWAGTARYVDAIVVKNGALPRHKDGRPHKARAIEAMLEFLKKNDSPPFPTRQSFYRWLEQNPCFHVVWWWGV